MSDELSTAWSGATSCRCILTQSPPSSCHSRLRLKASGKSTMETSLLYAAARKDFG